MKLTPLGDKVVVQRIAPQETTAGGIVLPEPARRRPAEGRVLSVGDGRILADGSHAALQVSEGDRVLFADYAGTEFRIDGAELLIMNESDILAVIE